MRFAVCAAVLAVLGLAGEWASSVIPVGWKLANTGVAWGDTHLALIGSGVLGGFAALHYWYPKITGRFMGTSLAGGSLWAIVAGTILMVVPIQLAGLAGMPVDVYKFYGDTGMSAYNLIGSLGAFLLAGGIILTLINAAASYNGGTEAPHDPWHGSTLEWFALSPPPPHNFDLVPDVRSNEAYRDIREAVAQRSTELVLPPASGAEQEPDAGRAEPVAVGASGGEDEQAAEGEQAAESGAADDERGPPTAGSGPESPEEADQHSGADTASGENPADDGDDRPVA
jgi:heme/copper-type cytochrome/quinol oxidase subunit 1